MLRTALLSLLLLLGGFIASAGTLFIPKVVHAQEELASLAMGWPFPFVRQNLSGYTPLSWPQEFTFVQPQDNPVTLHVGWFVANVVVLSVVLLLVFWSLSRAGRAAVKHIRH